MYNGGGGPAFNNDNEGLDPDLHKQRSLTGTYNQMTSGTNAVGKNSCLLINELCFVRFELKLTIFLFFIEMVEMDEMNQRAISTNYGIGGQPRTALNYSAYGEDIESDKNGIRKRNRPSNGYGEDFDSVGNEDFPTEGMPEDGNALSP